ncbi:hypothetical protein ACQ9ZF_11320 (plasmid) [Cetobacterium somerae]|uniref:hypothetical protein n=1 Tax=Cetobacterium somerae TaxID=188913 RepID=UPI003D76803C
MNKKLKSFHKLFFIILFSVLFATIIGNDTAPNLANKIAPELEQIEALPRRTKPAELNIEVTKIKSEPLEEVYIDRENKNIYVDFSKKREQALKGVKNVEDLEKKYSLVISEKAQSNGEVIGKGRTKMVANPQVMAYEMDELDGKTMLKIPYENEPEKLYISVQENNQVIKVYRLVIKKSLIIKNSNVIDRKTIVLNLVKTMNEMNDKEFKFSTNGEYLDNSPGVEYTIFKQNGDPYLEDEGINAFETVGSTIITSITKDGFTQSETADKNADQPSEEMRARFTSTPNEELLIKFEGNGSLYFKVIKSSRPGPQSYTFNIIHESELGKKEHTFIINAGNDLPSKEDFTYINPENNKILIRESELRGELNSDGTIKDPNKIYKFYSQEDIGIILNREIGETELFPAIYLGDEKNEGGHYEQQNKNPYKVKLINDISGVITLTPYIINGKSSLSYRHTVLAGSAPEKPSEDTFYNAVGGGILSGYTNAIYTRIAFYVTGTNLEKILKKSKESQGQLVYQGTYSLSPGIYLNSGNNCWLPYNVGEGSIITRPLPPIVVEKDESYKEGEIDLIIRSGYNPAIENGILLKAEEISYNTSVLDLNLITGNYPYQPTDNIKNVSIKIQEDEFQLGNNTVLTKTLTNGTKISIKQNENGEISIKPFYWENNKNDSFNLIYKNENEQVIETYKFNIKTPNFFVVSSGGVLDFGKIYTMGNPKDVVKEIDIELEYNSGNIQVNYSLDIDNGIPESGILFLDDKNNKLLTKFKLGEERKDSDNSKRRNIKLTGIIEGESIKGASPGTYEKTLQLLIHIQ